VVYRLIFSISLIQVDIQSLSSKWFHIAKIRQRFEKRRKAEYYKFYVQMLVGLETALRHPVMSPGAAPSLRWCTLLVWRVVLLWRRSSCRGVLLLMSVSVLGFDITALRLKCNIRNIVEVWLRVLISKASWVSIFSRGSDSQHIDSV